MRLDFRPAYVTTLPSGLTVGDEFRVAGRVRVVAVSEDTVDVTRFGDEPGSGVLPGELRVELRFTDIKEES